MKIITLFKSFLAVGVVAGGVTSAVVFSNMDNITAPHARVLTKANYDLIRSQQGTKNININYETLPTSNKTIVDLLTSSNPSNEAFMFTVGSQAYKNTNLLLNGNNADFGQTGGDANVTPPKNSLMLDLYDLFYGNSNPKLSSINMSFYSYIDIVSTKEYKDAEELLTYRKTSLGRKPDPLNGTNDASNVWDVQNANGNWDPTVNNVQPVVRDGAEFNYYPNYDSFYEFRPNNLYATEYEKVYYRCDAKTKEFLDATSWISKYATGYINQVFSNEGTLFCAKYSDVSKAWVFKSFSSVDDFKNSDTTIQAIIDFYLL